MLQEADTLDSEAPPCLTQVLPPSGGALKVRGFRVRTRRPGGESCRLLLGPSRKPEVPSAGTPGPTPSLLSWWKIKYSRMDEMHPLPPGLQRPSSQQHPTLVPPEWLCTGRGSLRASQVGQLRVPAVGAGAHAPTAGAPPPPPPTRSRRTGPPGFPVAAGFHWNSRCAQVLRSAGCSVQVPVTPAGSGRTLITHLEPQVFPKAPRQVCERGPPAGQPLPPQPSGLGKRLSSKKWAGGLQAANATS